MAVIENISTLENSSSKFRKELVEAVSKTVSITE